MTGTQRAALDSCSLLTALYQVVRRSRQLGAKGHLRGSNFGNEFLLAKQNKNKQKTKQNKKTPPKPILSALWKHHLKPGVVAHTFKSQHS